MWRSLGFVSLLLSLGRSLEECDHLTRRARSLEGAKNWTDWSTAPMSLVSPGAAAALAAAQIPERAAEDVAYSLPQDSGGQGIPGARGQNAT